MKYTKLYGFSDRETKELNSIEEVANFIMKEGLYSDVKILTEEGEHLLDTFGIFINKISDMEYREQLLKVLIPMQTKIK
jgi:hypothetical protein